MLLWDITQEIEAVFFQKEKLCRLGILFQENGAVFFQLEKIEMCCLGILFQENGPFF